MHCSIVVSISTIIESKKQKPQKDRKKETQNTKSNQIKSIDNVHDKFEIQHDQISNQFLFRFFLKNHTDLKACKASLACLAFFC